MSCTLKLMLTFTVLMFIISRFLPRVFVLLFTSVPEYMDFSVWGIQTFTLMIIPLSFQYVFCGFPHRPGADQNSSGPLRPAKIHVRGRNHTAASVFSELASAFYGEPLADGISSVITSAVFLLLIDRHLAKRSVSVSTPAEGPN